MRILKFIVDGQKIRTDPECEFSNLIPGTKGYLEAQFVLSSEWIGCKVAASFWRYDKEYPVLLKNGQCEIPEEVLKGKEFSVSLTGMKKDYVITTGKIKVKQEG